MRLRTKMSFLALSSLVMATTASVQADMGSCYGAGCEGPGGYGWVLRPPNCNLSASDLFYLGLACAGACNGNGGQFSFGSGGPNLDWAICECGGGCGS